MAHTYLITGANRGIGLEFTRQLAGRAASGDAAAAVVLATTRDPDRAAELRSYAHEVLTLDVADEASIASLAQQLRGRPIDVLINNAGVSSERTKSLADMDPSDFRRVMDVNAISPVLVARALLPNLRAGRRKLIVNITSVLASIARNTGGSSYAYRASKCALNMLTVCMSNELRPEGFTCVAVHPGWVQTDMGGPNATITPHESVGMMLKTFDQLTDADNGRYLNYDGTGLPW